MVNTEENGLVTSTRLFSIDGEPVVGRWSKDWPFAMEELGSALTAGVHGVHHEYDSRSGRATRLSFTDTQGAPAINREVGYAALEVAYDERGNPVDERYLDVDGAPMLGPMQFFRLKVRYNDRGLLTETAVFGLDDEPSLGIRGYHRMKAKLNADGRTVEMRYLDAQGLPVTRVDEGCAVRTIGWDRQDEAWSKCFGPDGEPAEMIPHGVHHVVYQRDIAGRETALIAKDGRGHPAKHWGGFFSREYDYDSYGHITETRYFDAEHKPMLSREGYARLVQEYDTSGNLVAESTFGSDGAPISPPGRAGFRIERQHDALGRVTLERVLGVDRQPIQGLAQTEFAFDTFGNEIERRFAVGDGGPADDRLGYSRIGLAYDDYGQVIRMAWFTSDGLPAVSEEGCRVQTFNYDELGMQTGVKCIGETD